MMRVVDWRERLALVIEGAGRLRFQWGRSDCCVFAGECMTAVIDYDPMRPLRGAYDTLSGARKVLGRMDMANVCATVGEPIGVAYARHGDLLLCEPEPDARWPFLVPAVVLDHRAVAMSHGQGLRYFPALSAAKAFAVGHG